MREQTRINANTLNRIYYNIRIYSHIEKDKI